MMPFPGIDLKAPHCPRCVKCGGVKFIDFVTCLCWGCRWGTSPHAKMEAALREIAERGCYADRQIAKKALGLVTEVTI